MTTILFVLKRFLQCLISSCSCIIVAMFTQNHRKGEAKCIDATFTTGKGISPVHNSDGAHNRQTQPMMGITSCPGGVDAIKPLIYVEVFSSSSISKRRIIFIPLHQCF